MRRKLEKLGVGSEHIFVATVGGFGTRSAGDHKEKTIVLNNIRINNKSTVCEHMWFNCTENFKDLYIGDKIQFKSKVIKYQKNWCGLGPVEWDYKLKAPKTVVKI